MYHRWNQNRIRQRHVGMKSLVVVLALLLAACSSSTHHTAGRLTTTTVRSTVQPTTTTTTQTVVSVAALVGVWLPVSVTGYRGPLTSPPFAFAPSISFDGNGHWNGTDFCNRFFGSYRLGSGGTIQVEPGSATNATCSFVGPEGPSPNSVLAAVRVTLSNGRLTLFARSGHELAQYERANVTARVVLPSTTMTVGSSMSGRVIVENNTGQALHVTGCKFLFAVALGNETIRQEPAFPDCGQRFTIPVGASRAIRWRSTPPTLCAATPVMLRVRFQCVSRIAIFRRSPLDSTKRTSYSGPSSCRHRRRSP